MSTAAQNAFLHEGGYSRYQTVLLRQLALQWEDHRRVLDIGGGNGIIAQAIHDIFGAEVTSIDIVNRFRGDLTIKTAVYDGLTLPFADGAFDAITLNNVLHHAPKESRARMIQECARVCSGPIYIKDHVADFRLDRLRLGILDVLGNLPNGGMVKASYLTDSDWRALFDAIGYTPTWSEIVSYRSGAFAALFPNRLEIFLKLAPCR